MAVDGESSRGPKFGPQPSKIYNKSHDGGATSKTDGKTPVRTVEKLLGGAPNVASSSTPSSTNIASFFDNRGICKLRNVNDMARPCHFKTLSVTQARHCARHLMYDHIFDELSRIRSGKLEVDRAEVLVSHERVRRAERYEWVCPVPGCITASLRRYELDIHIHQVHDGNLKILNLLKRKGSRLKHKTLINAMEDVLAAD